MSTAAVPPPLQRPSDHSISLGSSSPSKGTFPSSSKQPRNPVALRLYKVLGTNFDDEATREALQTLSELYGQSTPVTPTTKGKEKDAEDLDDDSEKVPTPTTTLSERVAGETAAKARKNLRRDMEQQLAAGSHQFLKVLGELDNKLDQLQTHLTSMRTSCEEAEEQLRVANSSSSDLLDRASTLQRERQEVEDKKSIISLFLQRFTLSDEESELVTSRDVPVGPQFFKALDKVERIQNDCRVLMAGEEGPTKAGLDIMEYTSSILEQAYTKIVRWSTNEFRTIGRDIQVEVSPTLIESIRRLRNRPELLTESLTQLSQTRQTAILSAFLTALTRGGPSGLPRPIALHAHDPIRYVGDMLAWVHQSIAAEREFLEGLFDVKGDGRIIGQARDFGKVKTEEEDWIRELMDLAVGRLCPPLKLRVQQTVKSQESSIMSYRIANLLQFYLLTMKRTIGEDAMLSVALQELTELANQVFLDAITAHGRTLSQMTLDLDDPSLTPPLAILDHIQILKEILTVFQASEDALTDAEKDAFVGVLDAMVDPTVEVIVKKSEDKIAARPKWDREVFILNSLSYLLDSLEPYSFTTPKQATLKSIINDHIDTLIQGHYTTLMSDANLLTTLTIIQDNASSTTPSPLSHIPQTSPESLQTTLHAFSIWLSQPSILEPPARLIALNGQYRGKVHHEALRRLAGAYEDICESVRNKENRYEAGNTIVGSERPFGKGRLVKQILGIEEEGV
ncbi:oligomeric Golgi complex subunit 6 [Flagelloscypha sp. PMI_526]|nr:oligomeric Golgi complex subunit 6 [Flagelloscypha sp. PMI_526]